MSKRQSEDPRGRHGEKAWGQPPPSLAPGMTAALVAVGGAIGASMRGILPVVEQPASLPWPTLAVNLGGSLALGVLLGWLRERGGRTWVKPVIGTGVLGGYTTFSAFAVETMMRAPGHLGTAGAYVVLTVFGAAVAAAIGLVVGRMASERGALA